MIANGKYSDGLLLDSKPVTVEFIADEHVLVRGEVIEFTVPLPASQISDRLGNVPRFLYLPDNAVIETTDNETIDQVLAARRRGNPARFIHFLETHSGIAVAATVALIVCIAYIIYYGVPALSREMAYRVPQSIDAQIGRASFGAIDRYFAPSKLDARQRLAVKEQLERVLPGRPTSTLPRLVFRSMGLNNANAFALPGNVIVVSDELVALSTRDDEIAAVLAHELGHLEKRHGLQSILRSSTALLVVSAITGDLSTLTNFAAVLPLTLLQKGYSREFEHEADLYARDLMLKRGISLKYFTSIMKKLEAQHPAHGAGLSYLSTHPATEDRIKLFKTSDPDELLEEPKPEDIMSPAHIDDKSKHSFADFKVHDANAAKPAPKSLAPSTPDIFPEVISQDRPLYPSRLREANIEGEVVVEFIIEESGFIYDASVVRSTNKEFETSAVEAVQRWRFKPQMKDGHPVKRRMQVPIVFSLNEEAPIGQELDSKPVLLTPVGSESQNDTLIETAQHIFKNTHPANDDPDEGANEARRKILKARSIYDLADYDIPAISYSPVRPRYPLAMQQEGIGGEVEVDVIIDTSGDVKTPFVLKSTRKEFEEAALDAVKTMKFTPAKKGRRAVDSNQQITITFFPEHPRK